MKRIILVIVATIFLAACTRNLQTQPPVSTPQPPVSECGITSCHGLDIECGEEIPQVCTLQYELGDFCRQFAQCGVVDGQCQQVENPTFNECKNCVAECLTLPEPADQFACEESCREQIEMEN